MTNFNFKQALNDLRAGKDLNSKDGILTPLIKQLTEAALKAELEDHLANEERSNRKNGYTQKTIKTALVRLSLIPHERAPLHLSLPLLKKGKHHSPTKLNVKYYPCSALALVTVTCGLTSKICMA